MEDRWQLVSAPEHAELIRAALEERRAPSLSKPALEVLAIVAYYQPTTRAYIDQVRGVDSSNTVVTLTEKGLIEECGRLEVPGRPIQYRTTPVFLRSFGLSTLEELPELPFGLTEEDGQLSL
jgi:segregation and condensation protein B